MTAGTKPSNPATNRRIIRKPSLITGSYANTGGMQGQPTSRRQGTVGPISGQVTMPSLIEHATSVIVPSNHGGRTRSTPQAGRQAIAALAASGPGAPANQRSPTTVT
jgi:hypothetical protein